MDIGQHRDIEFFTHLPDDIQRFDIANSLERIQLGAVGFFKGSFEDIRYLQPVADCDHFFGNDEWHLFIFHHAWPGNKEKIAGSGMLDFIK